jgi:sugar phosphate isomerase/epimerase
VAEAVGISDMKTSFFRECVPASRIVGRRWEHSFLLRSATIDDPQLRCRPQNKPDQERQLFMQRGEGISRREFVLGAAGFAAIASVADADSRTRLRLGGPIFLKSEDPVELAREHRRLGYRAAYVPPVTTDDHDKIAAISKAFAAQDVVIAEVGAWKNLMDSDEAKRKANLAYVMDRMALAEEIGAINCVTISGSLNPKQWDGPDPRNDSAEFFDATVENSRKILDSVKPKRTRFSLEMMPWAPPEGAEGYMRLIRAIDRPMFGVHVDMCNLINTPEEFYKNGQLIRETFKKLGKWVLSCHAKDIWGHEVHFAETIPGQGGLDYTAYLTSIAAYAPTAPLMLEHLATAEEYDQGREYIQQVAQKAGISFS